MSAASKRVEEWFAKHDQKINAAMLRVSARQQTYAEILRCTMRATADALILRGKATRDSEPLRAAADLYDLIPVAHAVDRHTLDLEALHTPEAATLRTMILSQIQEARR